ncbi:MAG: hypothetical protein ACRDP1_14075 [Nocardioidaceae bacterium]
MFSNRQATNLTAAQLSRFQPKLALLRVIQQEHPGAGRVSPRSCPPGSPCVPNSGAGPLPHPLYAEGEGDGGKTYTCGPSATRNMVKGMTEVDYGEAQFVSWEHTTTDGTSAVEIRDALNAHFFNYGAWNVHVPSSTNDLMGRVADDVYYGQTTIQNVLTSPLPFWAHVAYEHFDVAYFYNFSTNDLGVADEWNHDTVTPDGGHVNPFGFHIFPAPSDYNAVVESPDRQVVW